MADFAVSYIVSRAGRRLSHVLVQESALLVREVRSQVEWIKDELSYMQEFMEDLRRSNPNQLELFEDIIRTIALEAEDAIDTFLYTSVKRRKKGVEYLLEKYDVAKELEQISHRMREISERIRNYMYEQTNIAVTVETPGSGVGAPTIVSPALEKLDHILTQSLITLDQEVMEIVKHVKDHHLGDTQNIVSSLNSTGELSHRAKLWLEEIEEICEYTVGVAENFMDRRERLSKMGRLWQVLYLLEHYDSKREFKKEMECISTQLEDALYRRWTFGDGGKDMGDKTMSRSRPASHLSLVRLTTAKVPFFLLYGAFLPFLFGGIIIIINFLIFALESGPTERKPEREEAKEEEKKSRQLTNFYWFDLIDFMVFALFYVLPVELMIFIQFGSLLYTIIAWNASLGRCLDENLKTIDRYLILMSAFFTDIEREEDLNERQKVWVKQLRVVAQYAHSLVAACPKGGFLFLIRRIMYASDISDLLNEILDISDRKNIYGFANIQGGRTQLVSTVQGSESENIVQHSGPEEHPRPHVSYFYRHITRLKRKAQLIKGEGELMSALFFDVQKIGELERKSKIWVDQMRGIAREAKYVIRQCDRELEHESMPLIYILLKYPVWYVMAKDINRIRNEIEDAWRRRNAYGLTQLHSRAESSALSSVQILRRTARPSLIVKHSKIVGFDEDVELLLSHLLSEDESHPFTSIVGIGGTGKTTLANLIFHHKAVKDCFDCRWVSVSPSWTVEQLKTEIANVAATQIMEGQGDSLKTQYRTTLVPTTGKKLFIVVDGIETPGVLTEIIPPDSSTTSRFLLTTRNKNVAKEAGTRSFVHHLQLLDDEQSWILFTRNLSHLWGLRILNDEKLTKNMKNIVARCGGLPSEVLKMSNLLSYKDVTGEDWSSVSEKLNQGQNPWSETLDIVMKLPSYLGRCLTHLKLFPADSDIPARRLVVLWVAEGLVHQLEEELPEQAARRYLTELIDLNMLQIAKRKPNGEVKICRLPNALRELFIKANAVSKDSNLLQLVDCFDQKDPWHKHIHGNTTSYSTSLGTYYKDVFSFLSFDLREGSKPGQDISNFLNLCISCNCLLLLRVLDLEGVYKPKLPEKIDKLTRLRYLGLRWTYLESLPSSISKLLKLQTLDLKHTYIHTLTSSIWKMELRHLFLSETYRTRFPTKPKRTGDSLSDLQTLWGLFVDEETPVKGGLDKLVNIRKLGIACQSMSPWKKPMESQLDAVADWIGELIYLESLRLKSRDEQGRPWNLHLKSLKDHFNLTDMYLLGCLRSAYVLSKLPPSLVELTLSHSKLRKNPMKILKDLPNLRSLSLLAESFVGKKMVCESESFPRLYVLKIWKLEQLKNWYIEPQALPSLRQLEIRSCPLLTKLPYGLWHVNSLLEFKVTNMQMEINIGNYNFPPNCEVHGDIVRHKTYPSRSSLSQSTSKRTRETTRLRDMDIRRVAQEKVQVNVDPKTGKASGPNRSKFNNYLGVQARSKVSILSPDWDHVEEVDKDQIWQDILTNFDIENSPTLRSKVLSSVATQWRQFRKYLISHYIFGDGEDKSPCQVYDIDEDTWQSFVQSRLDPSWQTQDIQKKNVTPHKLSHGGYNLLENKIMKEKLKRRQESTHSNLEVVVDPPSPPTRHKKWKHRTKQLGKMTSMASYKITNMSDSLVEQSTQCSFVPHGRQDMLTTTIRRLEHPGCVSTVGVGVGIQQYFEAPSCESHTPTSISPEVMEQLRQTLTREITKQVTERLMRQFNQRLESLGLSQQVDPIEPHVGHFDLSVSTNRSCVVVDPSREETYIDFLDQCELYVDADPSCLVAKGRIYEGGSTIHHMPIQTDLVRMVVEEVQDAGAQVPVPTVEVQLIGQPPKTCIPRPRRLVKAFSAKDTEGPNKQVPPKKGLEPISDLVIELSYALSSLDKKPLQVKWDASVFGVDNNNVPLYLYSQDVLEIAQGNKMLNISVIQLWMMHLDQLSQQMGNVDLYGFLEPQSIQKSGNQKVEAHTYIHKWMNDSNKWIYLAPYINDSHWQLLIICPKDNVAVWLCSLHKKPTVHMKNLVQIAVSACNELDGRPTSKPMKLHWIIPKCNKQNGGYECGYYVMHWMLTIVRSRIVDYWEEEFKDQEALPQKTIEEIQHKWVNYFLKIGNR